MPKDHEFKKYSLRPRQGEFIQSYLHNHPPKSLVLAPPGTGKTITVLALAKAMMKSDFADWVLFLTDRTALRDQWRAVARSIGI